MAYSLKTVQAREMMSIRCNSDLWLSSQQSVPIHNLVERIREYNNHVTFQTAPSLIEHKQTETTDNQYLDE